jgi:hypothetical protein
MTMGPEPINKMVWRSVRLGIILTILNGAF